MILFLKMLEIVLYECRKSRFKGRKYQHFSSYYGLIIDSANNELKKLDNYKSTFVPLQKTQLILRNHFAESKAEFIPWASYLPWQNVGPCPPLIMRLLSLKLVQVLSARLVISDKM